MRRGPVTVAFVAGEPDGPVRVAYAVGRRAGGAVQRNRLRRRLRALVWELGHHLGPGAYLVSAGPEARSLSAGELRANVAEAFRGVTEGVASEPGSTST
ncbi:MAG: ribonuclease P protein component [Actinomycetota bacterium]|nr:ribonuclease P protein component [Actinomycetota bacterium]